MIYTPLVLMGLIEKRLRESMAEDEEFYRNLTTKLEEVFEMAILSFDDIMAAHDVTEKEIPVPEWGGDVVVRSISHREMRDIKKKVMSDGDDEISEDEVEKWVFIKGLVTPAVDEDQFNLLMEKSTGAIQKVLSGILGTSNATETAVTEEEKSVPDGTSGVLPVPTSGGTAQDGSGTPDGGAAGTQ